MKKIPTLFERVFENHKIVDVTPNITEGCEEAFLHGVATIKIDGSCCAIINGEFYKRYDAKGKKIPDGAIPCQDEPDAVTGHFPCWVKCDRENKADKWFWVAYDTTRNNAAGDLPDGTYEAIGRHFQGNPYHFDEKLSDILYRHGCEEVEVERTFEGVKKWLESVNHEGLVFWLNGEPVCKIKRSDFGYEWGKNR